MDGFPGGPYRVESKLLHASWVRIALGALGALLALHVSVSKLGDVDQQNYGLASVGWGLVVGVSLVRVGLRARADLARARRAGAAGAPVECRITSRQRLRNFGTRNAAQERVTFEVPGKNGAVQVTRTLRLADGAIIAFDHGATLLAIVPREHPQDAVVLRDGFAPFDLPAESRRAADAAVAGRKKRGDKVAKVREPSDGG